MDLIRSFIERTLKNDEDAAKDYTAHIQRKAQEMIKAAQAPQSSDAVTSQIGTETEPTA